MIRRYNFTDRKKILRKYVSLRMFTGEAGFQEFEVTLDLSSYDFPVGTAIFIEAYYRSSMMRFPMGLVSENQRFYTYRNTLSDLQDPQVNFRIKLVDQSQHLGRLIGIADKIQTFNENSKQIVRVGLLPVKFTDLNDQIWMLDIPSDGTGPVLCVNATLNAGNIPIAGMLKSTPFITLVFPEI